MPGASSRAWHALIRTHHITSRKKVAKLRQAASAEDVYALIRYGGAPGIMYVQGRKGNVDSWVAAVQVCPSVSTYLTFFLCNLVADSPYRNKYGGNAYKKEFCPYNSAFDIKTFSSLYGRWKYRLRATSLMCPLLRRD